MIIVQWCCNTVRMHGIKPRESDGSCQGVNTQYCRDILNGWRENNCNDRVGGTNCPKCDLGKCVFVLHLQHKEAANHKFDGKEKCRVAHHMGIA